MTTPTAPAPPPTARLGWFTAAAIAAWHWRARILDLAGAAGEAVLDFADKVADRIHQPADACDGVGRAGPDHARQVGPARHPLEVPGSTYGGVLSSPLDSPHHPPLYLVEDVHVPGDGLPWADPVPWGPYDRWPYGARAR